MIRKLTIPKLSTNVDEATVTAWIKREGDLIRKGEPIAELTTDKAAFEYESPCSGTLRRILAQRKSTIPVGYIIALIGDAADLLPDVAEANRRLMEKHRQAGGRKRPLAVARAAGAAKPVIRETPAARRLAREFEIDLATIETKADVITEEMVKRHLTQARK